MSRDDLCALCQHYRGEHDQPELGHRCRVRFGAMGDSAFMQNALGEVCTCPGFESEPAEPTPQDWSIYSRQEA